MTPVLDSGSFSESESLPYETREDMAADILDVVNWPEAGGRDFRCDKLWEKNRKEKYMENV